MKKVYPNQQLNIEIIRKAIYTENRTKIFTLCIFSFLIILKYMKNKTHCVISMLSLQNPLICSFLHVQNVPSPSIESNTKFPSKTSPFVNLNFPLPCLESFLNYPSQYIHFSLIYAKSWQLKGSDIFWGLSLNTLPKPQNSSSSQFPSQATWPF